MEPPEVQPDGTVIDSVAGADATCPVDPTRYLPGSTRPPDGRGAGVGVGVACGVARADAVGGALGTAAETGEDLDVELETPVLAAHALARSPIATVTTRADLRV